MPTCTSPDPADKARKKIRDAAGKLAEGRVQEARGKLQELGEDLAEARRGGELADGPLTALLAGAGFRWRRRRLTNITVRIAVLKRFWQKASAHSAQLP
ncbi:CsbD family protein [Nonomuraea gerenzanensis]|uniref:Uncharacterized protein n=1 Tax=Nonomuraea gerenzanensis TaxID=93944 RepID=A0A1M4DYR4_9ACTN|nr:CsbD family protein [Nonomuraea gerenzanensis]UBU14000.1 CsbD family protein [Nonomuraea gerenzanensis]SBO91683.1 hypothetical protein BN4615_P1197 [Nonomuraea gerenzanensis]